MKKTIMEIYALTVCLFAMIGFTVSLGVATCSVIQIAKPTFTLNTWKHEKYQSNDSFWQSQIRNATDNDKKKLRPGEAELSQKRHQAFLIELMNEKRDGTRTLINSLIIMLINIAVFFVHWTLGRRSRNG